MAVLYPDQGNEFEVTLSKLSMYEAHAMFKANSEDIDQYSFTISSVQAFEVTGSNVVLHHPEGAYTIFPVHGYVDVQQVPATSDEPEDDVDESRS